MAPTTNLKPSWFRLAVFIGVITLAITAISFFHETDRERLPKAANKGYEIIEPSPDYLLSKASFDEIIDFAKKGNPSAQALLAHMFLTGEKGASRNANIAIEWARKAAGQGNGEGAMILYYIYNASEGVPPQFKNEQEATKWLRVAADNNVNRANVILGTDYICGSDKTRNDDARAFSCFSKAAKNGDLDATYFMGECYANSWGVAPDPQMAIRYLSLAADAKFNFFYKAVAQRKLAEAYKYGYGTPKNTQKAFEYFSRSAFLGDIASQFAIAYAYESGEGVVQNTSAALVWLYVCRANGGEVIPKTMSVFERSFDQNTLVTIRANAREVVEQIRANINQGSTQSAGPTNSSGPKSYGSGVIVSSEGLIVTAAHVVEGSSKIEVISIAGKRTATIVEIDPKNDLAVLRIGGSVYPAAPLTSSRDVKMGQAVFTIGFPNKDIQGASPKLTRGEISSVSGIRDEPTQWQISVPVQSGNSGSPLFDESGNVVGIVVSKLNALETAKTTGDLVQNVNYAVKNAYLMPMLEKFSDKLPSAKKRGIFKKFETVVEDSKKTVVLILAY